MSKEKRKVKYSYEELKEKYIDRKVKPVKLFGKQEVTALSVFITFVINLLVLMVVAVVSGYFLDRWLKTTPLFIVIFILLGVLATFRNLFTWYYKQEVNKRGKQTSNGPIDSRNEDGGRDV